MSSRIEIKTIKIAEAQTEAMILDDDGTFTYDDLLDEIHPETKEVIKADSPHWKHFAKQHKEELSLLGKTYDEALQQAKDNNYHTVGIRLLSKGQKAFPDDKAWDVALQRCQKFLDENPDCNMKITFCVANKMQEQKGNIAKKRNQIENRE